MPGDVALWPGLTGGQCLDIFAATHGGVDERRRAELIERFDLDPTKRARDYSKGNRQKVALVAGLATTAQLLVLDEPTSGLDPLMEQAFQEVVHERRDDGVTVLLSSHILGEVEALADRVTHHPQGPPGPDRHPRRPAPAHPHHGPCGHRGADRRRSPTPRASPTTSPNRSTATSTRGSPSTLPTSTTPSAGCTRARIHTLTVQPPSLDALFLRSYGDDIAALEETAAEADLTRPGTRREARPMSTVGLGTMTRIQLRTRWKGLVVWVLALAGSLAGTAASIAALYDTPAKIKTYADAVAGGALYAINGQVEGIDSLGGVIQDEFGFMAAFLLPLLGHRAHRRLDPARGGGGAPRAAAVRQDRPARRR